jgi:glycine cleavage system aminomethyltransferase T/glycine/D-amino acid oxidase-like deaminating enzyme
VGVRLERARQWDRRAVAVTEQQAAAGRRPIELPDRAQVVIIGGGVIGASIAYHLTRLGWRDVVLLERRQLTSGTTWHAAGLITAAGMATETLLWMARYTRDLCTTLEQETGQATGFRPIGHLHLATTPRRLEGMRREAAFARRHGVDNQEISAAEFGRLWPAAKTDDVLAAFYVPDEGRVNPADLTMAYARGARAGGARIFEHVAATGVTQERGRVTGVVTDHGTIAAEYVVNAAGLWARELGARSGVSVPLQAAEHYYLITDTVDWAHPDLPIVEEPDRYGYYREEGGGILVGLFEPMAAPWSLDRVPDEIAFASLPPDWDRIGPYLSRALDRFPSLHDAGVRTMFCGPESFTTDNMPQLGESPELRGYFVAAGMNSLGILLSGGVGSVIASWIVDGVPPQDVTGMAVDRTQAYETSRRFRADRTVELLGDLFGDAAFPNWHPRTARNVRRSVIHDRLAAAGAHFAPSSGWEYAEWFAEPGTTPHVTPGWGRDASFALQAAEHHAVREAVGMLDMSLMAKFLVQGRDAGRVLNLVSAADVAGPIGRIVYTPWLNAAGGIEADLTVTRLGEARFLVVVTDLIHRRIAPWIERHVPEGAHATVTDVTSGTTLLTVQGPRSRQLLERLSSADLSNEAFPYLTAKDIDLGYARVLAMRVTYVGELGWELHVPAELALTVYDQLMEAGEDLGYRNVGLGAMGSLRLEKAYRDYGLDIDNTDTPLDVGLGFTVAWDKPGGFVGHDALLAARAAHAAGPPTRRLVQVLVEDADPLLFGGEPVYLHGRIIGTVRAGAYGHTLGGAVGLAMLEDAGGIPSDAVEHGHFEVDIAGVRYPARASIRPLYDPDRNRIRA